MSAPGNPLRDYLFRERAGAWLELAQGVTTPARFTDALTEHAATRHTAGLFDFSFMACVEIAGAGGAAFLERLQPRSARHMQRGQIAYTLLCRDDGTVLNDATVWCQERGRYTIFTGRRSDLTHLRESAAGFDVMLDDVSDERATCALQGPLALRVLDLAFPGHDWPSLPYFRFRRIDFEGAACDIGRLGYSGEAGFEAVIDAAAAPRLWQRLASAGGPLGLAECGFEAADILRVEAGFILFTRELAHPVTPYELRLERLMPPPCSGFIGARALRSLRWQEPARCLSGLHIDDRAAPLPADAPLVPGAVLRTGRAVVTSVAASPLFRRSIGLGFVAWEDRFPGSTVQLQTGHLARVTRLPFYDPAKVRPRRDWTLARVHRATGD